MADWKTYAKAARNTARKQAPGAKDAARRASDRAGSYVRAAGKAIDEGRRAEDDPPRREREGGGSPRRPEADEHRRGDERRRADERHEGDGRTSTPRTATAESPRFDQDRLRKDAAAYYTVASRRGASANIVPRLMRALRDALLIGLSLFVIWGVLAAAGIPIPFTTVLIIVALIVLVSFAGGVYAQWKRAQAAREESADPRER